METSLFPLVKRFKDIESSISFSILLEELIIHEKCFREGSIFHVIGWREIENRAYLIINKGSWEGLISFEEFQLKMKKLNGSKFC